MKIVVLDGHTLNPGDLSWEALNPHGVVTVHERTAPQDVLARAEGAEVLFTNKTPLKREHFAALPKLRYVGVLATGYNVVDVAAARERGIVVTNVPEYGTAAVAQHAIALLLELTQRVGAHAEAVRNGEWARCPDFCFARGEMIELEGKTLGLFGLGRIGARTGEIARALGMNVIVHSRTAKPGWETVSREELFKRADVVSLHCPLTDETRGVVNETVLRLMKPTAFLLNTARGPLVDEAALARALNEGWIAGAGLDVLSVEPPAAGHPLFTAKNCLVTPHNAWAARSARERLLRTAVGNLEAFLTGQPRNVVK